MISAYGNKIIPVANGELASGLYGEGRMAEPEEIVAYLKAFFEHSAELKGKKSTGHGRTNIRAHRSGPFCWQPFLRENGYRSGA